MLENGIGRSVPACINGTDYRPYHPVAAQPPRNKLASSFEDAIKMVGLTDGMTISFHHAFRDGDLTVRPVMEAIRALGIKNLRLAPSSLTDVHDFLVEFIECGTISRLESSGLRGRLGKAISEGILPTPVILRSHGDRVRALKTGELTIDVAFMTVSNCDVMGNANGTGGKNPCGSLGYAMIDAQYANKCVLITDTIADYPCTPAILHQTDVDVIVKIDDVGDTSKMNRGATRKTKDPKQIMIAKRCAKVIASTQFFKEGFVFQTGGGAVPLATTMFLQEIMEQRGVHAGMVLGGSTESIYNMYKSGMLRSILTAQSLDATAARFVNESAGFSEISIGQYADPTEESAYIHKLDYVVLSTLEMDTDFNCNILTGSNGELRGALGGGPDTAAGAKVTIVAFPLIRGRIPCVVDQIQTVCTPGSSIDVAVTDYGCAVNPNSPYYDSLTSDLAKAGLPLITIAKLRDKAYALTGRPAKVAFDTSRIVALVEYRGGSLIDVVYQTRKEEA